MEALSLTMQVGEAVTGKEKNGCHLKKWNSHMAARLQKGCPNVYRGYKYPDPYVAYQYDTPIW